MKNSTKLNYLKLAFGASIILAVVLFAVMSTPPEVQPPHIIMLNGITKTMNETEAEYIALRETLEVYKNAEGNLTATTAGQMKVIDETLSTLDKLLAKYMMLNMEKLRLEGPIQPPKQDPTT